MFVRANTDRQYNLLQTQCGCNNMVNVHYVCTSNGSMAFWNECEALAFFTETYLPHQSIYTYTLPDACRYELL